MPRDSFAGAFRKEPGGSVELRRPAVALPPLFQDLFAKWRPEYKVVFWTVVFTLQKLLIYSEHKALGGLKGHKPFFFFFTLGDESGIVLFISKSDQPLRWQPRLPAWFGISQLPSFNTCLEQFTSRTVPEAVPVSKRIWRCAWFMNSGESPCHSCEGMKTCRKNVYPEMFLQPFGSYCLFSLCVWGALSHAQ